jgi:6-phosphofructokinase 1
VQRGGTPTAFDRMLATRYGLGAIDAVHHGDFGKMVALRGNKIVSVPVSEAIAKNRTVDQDALDIASGILEEVSGKK